MNSKTTLPISEARKRIFDIAQEVQQPGTVYTLTEKGVPKVVLMSASEFESWVETLEVMEEFPDLKKDLQKVDDDIATGAYKKYATLEDVMARYGFLAADKPRKQYVVAPKNGKKGRKRA